MSLEALPFVHHIVYNVAHQICNGYYRKILFHRYLYCVCGAVKEDRGVGGGCCVVVKKLGENTGNKGNRTGEKLEA